MQFAIQYENGIAKSGAPSRTRTDTPLRELDFESNKYIVSKITPPRTLEQATKNKNFEGFKAYVSCSKTTTKDERVDGEIRHFNACLKVQELGEKRFHTKGCIEFHTKLNETKTWEIEFNCDGFKFTPNGYFHMTHLHSHLSAKPKNDYKDSLFLTVGRCADISD